MPGITNFTGQTLDEMQVIGELEGSAGWHEVMDMASGKVYFWESATNVVAWDPPEGSRPRSTSLQHENDLQAQRDNAASALAQPASSSVFATQPASELPDTKRASLVCHV